MTSHILWQWVTSMGMIGYAMSHAKEHEWSERIATLVKRQDVTGHLISETK